MKAQGQQAKEEIVPFDSGDAAQRKSVEGWVSRNGYFYGDDERTARYSGCTHVECAGCSTLIPKTTLLCDDCTTAKRNQAYAAMERVEWDNVTPLVILDTEIYFFDRQSIIDYCEEKWISPDDLQLIICKPVYGHHFDAADFLSSELPEGADIPDQILEAANRLNHAIRNAGPLSWVQGDHAAIINLFPLVELEENDIRS